IASYTEGEGGEGAGKTAVYSGRTGRALRTFTFTEPNAAFGVDAIAVGDVNGDTLTDYLVTAVGLSFANKGPGCAYLIAGGRLKSDEG
ncbi:MAG: hypothetical protein AAF658_12810, partial [Myxococcota bacterium]